MNDHLGLLVRSFANLRMIVFTGMSGSGKTTYIEMLLAEHPDFSGRDHTKIRRPLNAFPAVEPPTELVVVDELQRPEELRHIARLMRGGHTALVASHLHPAWVWLFNMCWPAEHYYTDQSTDKLQHFLKAQGVQFTPEVVREFSRLYGANYTDLQIILEHSGGQHFDLAFDRFRRSARLKNN